MIRRILTCFVLALTVGALFVLPQRAAAVTLSCAGFVGPNEIVATGGVTRGTSGNDTMYGLGGNDRICDDSGVNTIYGGAGNDILSTYGNVYGETGDDIVDNYAPTGVADGGVGNDRVGANNGSQGYGGAGNDTVFAQDGGTANGAAATMR